MFRSLLNAVGQLGDPAIRRLVWLSAGLALTTLVGLVIGAAALLARTTLLNWPWLDIIVDVLGVFATLFLAALIFPAAIGLIAGLFAERVADAVDRRHHPDQPPCRHQSVGEAVSIALRFTGLIVLANLLVALLSFWLPGLNLLVLLALNGYLLGREYFEIAAVRRLDPAQMRTARRRHGATLWLGGMLIAGLLATPVVNLLVPVIATAFMVHEVERLNRGTRSP